MKKKNAGKKVKDAANIILEDIHDKTFENSKYPAADEFFENLEDYVPRSLYQLLFAIITNDKKDKYTYHTKILACAHNIVSLVYPKKFISPLQLGLSVTLYHRFGSKDLLQILSNLGFSASYAQTLLYQASVITFAPEPIIEKSFGHCVFDNADHNVNTIDGHNTFHKMGGILIIAPHSAVKNVEITKLNKFPKAKELKNKGIIQLQYFQKDPKKNMNDIIFEILPGYDLRNKKFIKNIKLSREDFLWIYSKYINSSNSTGWNNFMEQLTEYKDYIKSRIIIFPFISAPPTNNNTIYTSLIKGYEMACKLEQKYSYVTFDLPLYIKALEIVMTSEDPRLANVIPILGTLHFKFS